MPGFTKGTCHHGTAIFHDGKQMTAEEIIKALEALTFLVKLKQIKDELIEKPNGRRKDFYNENKPIAWIEAENALGL